MLLYLTPTDVDALRVVVGSHLPALHRELEPLHADCDGVRRARGRHSALAEPMADTPVPSYACAARPSDVVLMHQSCLHAVFSKPTGRRYLALKFTARPRSDADWASLWRHGANMFKRRPERSSSQ